MYVVRCLRMHPDILFTNGGAPTDVAGIPFDKRQRALGMSKAKGYRVGWPDLFIANPSGDGYYPGLFVEMKRERGGVVSPEQKEVGERLQALGYCWYVARGAEDALQFIERYLYD